MAERRDLMSEAQQAIYTAIIEQTKQLDRANGQSVTAEAVKNLAEAYAWATYGNQPH
ncbi:hypothetical protein ABT185_07590 [Streptomyces clavifer]|uniref:hypothetical protein n=1 Tax=Streptomyces clavifer TaxID=68188 RepID=UPI00331E2FFE